jgi:hypothetical protein
MKVYQLATVCFFCTTILFVSKSRELKTELNTCNEFKLKSDSLCMDLGESVLGLRKHVRINFILDSMLNENTYTKQMKQNHKELLTLTRD